jgi:NMD protein affecting ribosome stability and mRNA decay
MTPQTGRSTRRKLAQLIATTSFTRNMVCNRCIKFVSEELQRSGLDVRSNSPGEAIVAGNARKP